MIFSEILDVVKNEETTRLIKIDDNVQFVVKKLNYDELYSIKFEIVSLLTDELSYEINWFLYDYVVNTRLLKYFAYCDVDEQDKYEVSIFLSSEVGRKILFEMKSCYLINSQIQEILTDVNKCLQAKENKFNYVNEEVSELASEIKVLVSYINSVADVYDKSFGDVNVIELAKKLANVDKIDKKALVEALVPEKKTKRKTKTVTNK